jgi:RHS repeat-associated protein
LATTWSYLANTGDRRLSGISHVGLSASNVSTWQFSSTPEDFITGVTETSDAPAVYPSPSQQTAAYNGLNQLTSLSAQTPLTYSATGNLLSDGQRVFAWDAEDRLVGITWPAQPGRQVTFAYDGQGRRASISSTPAGGGGTTTTSYVWCGASLCQVRNAANAVTRAYYDEGEFVPGAPAQRLYYGADQIGSVRRVFASTGSAPAYAYDPYGVALQGTAPLTDFGYAGMFWHADSGLYLTQYRAYDPTLGRWLSRDPYDEGSDPQANLYTYVGGNPVTLTDPTGGWWPIVGGVAAGAAYLLTAQPANAPGPCDPTYEGNPWAPLVNAALAGSTIVGAQIAYGLWAMRAGGTGIAANAARGKASEARVLRDMGLSKNTQAVQTAEGRAIPDALTNTMSVEIKDAATVNLTRQLRIQSDTAKASGRTPVLVTGQNTNVSGPAGQTMQVIRRPDLGPP